MVGWAGGGMGEGGGRGEGGGAPCNTTATTPSPGAAARTSGSASHKVGVVAIRCP